MTDLTFSVRCPRFVRKLITDVMRSELSLSYGSMDHPVLKTVRETAAKVAKIEAVLGTDSAEWKDKLHAEIRRSASAVGVSGKGVQSVSISRAPRSDALTGDTVRGIVREGVEQLLAAFQGVETLLEDRHRFEDARDAEQCDLTFARRLAAMQYRGREFSLNDEGHGGVGGDGPPVDGLDKTLGGGHFFAHESSPSVVGCGDPTVGDGLVAGVEHTAPATEADESADQRERRRQLMVAADAAVVNQKNKLRALDSARLAYEKACTEAEKADEATAAAMAAARESIHGGAA